MDDAIRLETNQKMPAAKKKVLDVLIIHLSIILKGVNGASSHCHNNDRRSSHVQGTSTFSTLPYAHYLSEDA